MPLAMRASVPDAAWNDDHGVGGIGTAGNVGADVGVGLRMNFAGGASEDLGDQVAAAAQSEFFGDHAQRAVGGDEVDGLDAFVAVHGEQQVAEKERAAGAGGRDGQVLRRAGHAEF